MRIVIINKSDSTGGAAVVSRRLMEAFRSQGIDARMLVVEKLSDSPYIEIAAKKIRILYHFLKERLGIFIKNGFNRETLFKIDTGSSGLPLWRHPLVKESDVIILNWINQGMLSLRGVKKILELGKPVLWTMHDMWNMTGICHHAHTCIHYKGECGECPLLGKKSSPKDLSHKIWVKKLNVYGNTTDNDITNKPFFVAVSSWLFKKGKNSSLLKEMPLETIGNAFPLSETPLSRKPKGDGEKIRILFGAARLDDPIKGLSTLKKMTKLLANDSPETKERVEIITFGSVKEQNSLGEFGLKVKHLGVIRNEEIAEVYKEADIVISASSYETLPGTLVEAQAYGCIPVSLDRGGQIDIITHLENGYLASYSEDEMENAQRLADGVKWAITRIVDEDEFRHIEESMRRNVMEKFSYPTIVAKYLEIIEKMQNRKNG